MPPPPPARKESLSVASKPTPPVRSASLSKPVPSSLEELPPPPSDLLESPREVAEEEYEQLVQEKGLLGALGFDDSEAASVATSTPVSTPVPVSTATKASRGQGSVPAAAMAAAAASIAQQAVLRQAKAGAKPPPAKPPAPTRSSSKSQAPVKTASEALRKTGFKKPSPPGRQPKAAATTPQPPVPAVQKPKLSFDPNPAEVVSTYAADEYIRSNASLDVEGAAFEADTESVAVSLHEMMEDTHDFFEITVEPDADIPFAPLTLECIDADGDVNLCGLVLGPLATDHPLRNTHNCAPGDVIVRVDDVQTLVTTMAQAEALLGPDSIHSAPIVLELARSFDAVADDVFPELDGASSPTAAARPVPARRNRSNPTLKPPTNPTVPQVPKAVGKAKIPPTRPQAPSKLIRSASVDVTRPKPSPKTEPGVETATGTAATQALLAEKEAVLNSRSERIAVLERELAESQASEAHLQTQVAELSAYADVLSAQVQELSTQEANEAAVLQTALAGASTRIETLESALATSQQALQEKEQQLEATRDAGVAPEAVAALTEEHAAKTARLEKQLGKANTIIQGLVNEKEGLASELAALKADKDDSVDKIDTEAHAALVTQVAELKVLLESHQSELETGQTQLAQLEEERLEHATQTTKLHTRIAELEATTDQSAAALATAQARIQALEAQIQSDMQAPKQPVVKEVATVVKEAAKAPPTAPQATTLATPKPVPTRPSVSQPVAATRKPKPERPAPPGSPTPKPRPKPAVRPSVGKAPLANTTISKPASASASKPQGAKDAAALLHAALMGKPQAEPSKLSTPSTSEPSPPQSAGLDDVFGALPTGPTLNNSAGRARAASASRAKVKRRPPTRHAQRARSTSPKVAGDGVDTAGSSHQTPVLLAGQDALEESSPDVKLRPKPQRGVSTTDDDPTVKRRSKFGALGAGLKKLRRKSGAVAFSADNPPAAATWTTSEVGEWLSSTGIANVETVVAAFKDANVDGETLLTLTTADSLKGLGVSSIGQRTLLKKKILDLSKHE